MRMQNAFGNPVYEPPEILRDKKVRFHIRKTLSSIFSHVGVNGSKNSRIVGELLRLAGTYDDPYTYEKHARSFLEKEKVTDALSNALTGRSEQIFRQVLPHVSGRILDLGCGDGKVGEQLAKTGHEVTLADTFEHRSLREIKLPFQLIRENGQVPIQDNSHDTVLALTVLHHSEDPEMTVKEACRIVKKGGVVVTIETVHGIPSYVEVKNPNEHGKRYLSLTTRQQRMSNTFFDHFWNRIVNFSPYPELKIGVPYNFNTSEGWRKLFKKSGLMEEKVIHLGVDQPTAPTFHSLHIYRKI